LRDIGTLFQDLGFEKTHPLPPLFEGKRGGSCINEFESWNFIPLIVL
jgi:hypothetical protein